jgi:PKD repeat protein
MVRRSLLALLILAASLPADWVRRADIQGNITDIAYPADRSAVYAAMDGAGVWAWNGAVTQWEERNGGLPDLRVRALAVKPDDPAWVMAATASGSVFTSTDGGQSWAWDSVGLTDFNVSYVPTDLSMVWDDVDGRWYTYMATLGGGIFRQAGLFGPWTPFNQGEPGEIDNKDILCIAAIKDQSTGRHCALAGARYTNDGAHPSRLYALYVYGNRWLPVTQFNPPLAAETSFTSIALHGLELAVVGTAAGTGTEQGVYYASSPFGSWNRVCSNPPAQPFWAVDYIEVLSSYTIAGGTPAGLWRIDDPAACSAGGGYTAFPRFRGKVKALAIPEPNIGLAGGPGKGPVWFVPGSPLAPVLNRREGIEDNNILDIGVSPSFGTSSGGATDHTIFTASGIAGAYKNTDPVDCATGARAGYFYRMIGDPDSWGTVSVLKVKPVPGYKEFGCAPLRRVFAATAGDGILRSEDGGRSWTYANGMQGTLAGTMVTDLVFAPGYDGTANRRSYAAVFGRGVYYSDDDGGEWFPLAAVPNARVLCLGVGSVGEIYAGVRAVNVPGQNHGLYKFLGGDWSAAGGSTMDNKSVTAIAASPYIAEWLFVGTEDQGVWASNSGGNAFSPINAGLPGSARIYDLKMGPWFNPSGGDTSLLTAVQPTNLYDGGVYYTNLGMGWTWNRMAAGLPTDSKALAVAFSPRFGLPSPGIGQVFCGHATKGLCTARIASNMLACAWERGAGFFNVPPDIAGVAVAPDDPNTVFAASKRDGLFISRDGGDTFRPWGAGLTASGCPVESTLSVAVTHTFSPTSKVFLDESFTAGIPATWTVVNGGTGWTWMANTADPCTRVPGSPLDSNFAIIDSDCESPSGTQDDVLYSPVLDTSSAARLTLKFDHHFRRYPGGMEEHGYVYVYSSGTNYAWVQIADYYGQDFGPESVTLDLTPYRGTSFTLAFYYTGGYDWWWALDHIWVGEAVNRVVVGTKDHGIYYADSNEGTYFGQFQPSNLTAGTVNEVRYKDMTEDMRASHVPDGDYHSADYGATWSPVAGVTPGLGLRDVTFNSVVIDRGLSGFVWGCSSGKSLGRGLGDGAAWYYNPVFDCDPGTGGVQACWQECPQTGLDANGDFRSIVKLPSGTILMGSIGTDSSPAWTGLYRSEDNCLTWERSDAGLPPSPMVYAFQVDGANGYVLASVVDSDLSDGDQGGVFYSETSSDGRAWAKTNLPSSTPSSYEMALAGDGSTLYTGLSSDGIFSTTPATIPIAQPAAYFEAADEACVGTAVQFYNYSAGKVSINAWTFGDGGVSAQANPSHTYGTAGTYYPSLTVTSGFASDTYPDLPFGVSLVVRDELDVGSSLQMAKTGTPGEVRLSWTDVDGESGYRIHASNDPAAPQASGDLPADTVSLATSAPYAYFRIQPLGSTYACGDGIVGGTW